MNIDEKTLCKIEKAKKISELSELLAKLDFIKNSFTSIILKGYASGYSDRPWEHKEEIDLDFTPQEITKIIKKKENEALEKLKKL